MIRIKFTCLICIVFNFLRIIDLLFLLFTVVILFTDTGNVLKVRRVSRNINNILSVFVLTCIKFSYTREKSCGSDSSTVVILLCCLETTGMAGKAQITNTEPVPIRINLCYVGSIVFVWLLEYYTHPSSTLLYCILLILMTFILSTINHVVVHAACYLLYDKFESYFSFCFHSSLFLFVLALLLIRIFIKYH